MTALVQVHANAQHVSAVLHEDVATLNGATFVRKVYDVPEALATANELSAKGIPASIVLN